MYCHGHKRKRWIAFECDDGWFDLIDNLSYCITNHIRSSRALTASSIRFNRALKKASEGDPSWMRHYLKNFSEDAVNRYLMEQLDGPLQFREVGKPCHKVKVAQVKEKFGSLRFYINGADDTIFGMISLAETMSTRTCEVCGDKGKIKAGGWIKTLCDKH